MTVLLGSSTATAVSTDFESAGVTFASKYVALATGTVDNVSIHWHSSNTFSGTVTCAIFSDSAGTPSTIIGNRVSMTVTSGVTSWQQSAGGMAAAVTSGTTYWIVMWAPSGGNNRVFTLKDNTTSAGSKDTPTGQASLVSPWPGSAGTFTEVVDAFAQDAGGGGGAVTPFLPRGLPIGV